MFTTILLVEDNELNRDMLSRRLERKGYVIKMAVDGAQGVSMATELLPALILMDLSLPVMDGCEAIRRLKADPETATIPIIALTAHARAEDEKTARDAGATDFDTLPAILNAPRCITEPLDRLGQLYDAWGKPDQTAEVKMKPAASQQTAKASDNKSITP